MRVGKINHINHVNPACPVSFLPVYRGPKILGDFFAIRLSLYPQDNPEVEDEEDRLVKLEAGIVGTLAVENERFDVDIEEKLAKKFEIKQICGPISCRKSYYI